LGRAWFRGRRYFVHSRAPGSGWGAGFLIHQCRIVSQLWNHHGRGRVLLGHEPRRVPWESIRYREPHLRACTREWGHCVLIHQCGGASHLRDFSGRLGVLLGPGGHWCPWKRLDSTSIYPRPRSRRPEVQVTQLWRYSHMRSNNRVTGILLGDRGIRATWNGILGVLHIDCARAGQRRADLFRDQCRKHPYLRHRSRREGLLLG